MKNNQFVCLKLRTNETLFAELVAADDKTFSITFPFQVVSHADGQMTLTEWIPYTNENILTLPHNICYLISNLSEKFVKFYGSIILQTEIDKIKHDVYESMTDRNDYHTMLDGIERMKKVTLEMSEKYMLDKDSVDFSTFEEKLQQFKPVVH